MGPAGTQGLRAEGRGDCVYFLVILGRLPRDYLNQRRELLGELGPWVGGGGPFARPHEFYGIGARRAKLQAESKCVNYRFVL